MVRKGSESDASNNVTFHPSMSCRNQNFRVWTGRQGFDNVALQRNNPFYDEFLFDWVSVKMLSGVDVLRNDPFCIPKSNNISPGEWMVQCVDVKTIKNCNVSP